jgi:VanZ family protein
MKMIHAFRKTIAWVVFMLVLFLIPSRTIPLSEEMPYVDKIVHTTFFMVFTILIIFDRLKYRRLNSIGIGYALIVFLLVLGFAVMVECLQEIMNLGREGDVVDIIFDLIGYALGLIIVLFLTVTSSRSL